MSLVEGELSVDIQLAAGSLARLQKQLSDLEKGISLRVKADTAPIQKAQKSVEQLHKTIAKTATATAAGSGPFTALNRSAATTRTLLDNVSKASSGAQGPLRSLGNVARSVGQNFTGLATAAAGYLSVTTLLKGVNLAADLQVQRKALENLTGSQQKANHVIEEARKISLGSGIAINEITSAIQKFIAQGMPIAQATAQAELLAKAVTAAGGGTQEFHRAAKATVDVLGKGVLQSEELRGQLQEALPSLQIEKFRENVAKNLGITTAAAKEMINDGVLPAKDAVLALNQTLSQSPGVLTSFEARASTLRGSLDKLKTLGFVALEKATGNFAQSMGAALASAGLDADKLASIIRPLFDGLTPVFAQLVTSFRQALPLLANLGQLFATLGRTTASVISLFSGGLFSSLNSIIGVLNRLGPLVQFVFGRFLVMQVITGVVASLNAVLSILPATMARTQLAVVGLGSSFLALAGPISAAIGLLLLFESRSKSVAQRVQDTLADLAIAVTDQDIAGAFIDNAIKGLEKADDVKKAFAQIFQVDPAAAQKLLDSLKRTNTQIFDEKGNVIDLGAELVRLTAERKKSNDELLRGLGIAEGASGSVGGLSEGLQKQFDALGKILDTQKGVTDAIKAGGAAQQATTAATHAAAQAHQRVNELVQQRNTLLQNQASEQREIAAGLDRVLRATASLRDLEQERVSLQAELTALQAPASAEDLESADIALERAVLALNKAKRDQLELDKALNAEQAQASVDLTGLSLDQIKTRLAGARAQLAVQRAAKATQDKAGKSQAELDDDRASKELDVRQATLDVEAAKKRVEELNNRALNNAEAIRENLEAQADLELDINAAKREQAEANEAARKLQAGDTQFARDLKGLNDQITTAKEGAATADQAVRTAVEAQRTAQDAITVARREQATLLATQLQDEQKLNQLFVDRAAEIAKMGGQAAQSAKAALAASLPALLAGSQLVDPKTGEPLGLGDPIITQAMIDQISRGILDTTSTDLRGVLRAILQKIGLRIPGLRKGGLVERAPTSFGSLHRLGERGREGVLPLTNAMAMRTVLADQRILNPVLAALPKVTLPTPLPLPRLNAARGSNVVGQAREDRRQKQLLREAFEEALRNVGQPAGDNTVNMTVNQTSPTAQLSSRQLERAVHRAIRR